MVWAMILSYLSRLFRSGNKSDSIRLLFVGDIMVHDAQIASAARLDGTYDFDPCFKHVAPIIKSADLAIGNLEVPLPGSPPYRGYPLFRSPNSIAEALKRAGFDVLVTANNHINDAGKDGLVQTIRTLDRLKIVHTGSFEDEAARASRYPLLVERNGFRLVFLNATALLTRPAESPSQVNMLNEDQMRADLREAESMRPDAVIVCVHWGEEYEREENEAQKGLAEKMLSWGADIIIGAHPHVIQPVRSVEQGGRKKLVAYSLGNFISNQTFEHTDGGLILEVELKKKSDAERLQVGPIKKRLVWRYIEKKEDGSTTHMVVPVAEAESGALQKFSMPDHAWADLRAYVASESGR